VRFDKTTGPALVGKSRNAFTRCVAATVDEYGYFFQVAKTPDFRSRAADRAAGRQRSDVDIRTLPFLRFDDNESHCQRRHAFDLGGGAPFGPPNIGDAGPDEKHPFVVRKHAGLECALGDPSVAQSLLLDGIDIKNADYGIWRPVYRNMFNRGVTMTDVPAKTHYGIRGEGHGEPAASDAGVPFPAPLQLVDDLPPVTVITEIASLLRAWSCAAARGQRRHRRVMVTAFAATALFAQLRRNGRRGSPRPQPRYTATSTDKSGQCGAQSARCGWGLVAGRGYESPGTRACAPGP